MVTSYDALTLVVGQREVVGAAVVGRDNGIALGEDRSE